MKSLPKISRVVATIVVMTVVMLSFSACDDDDGDDNGGNGSAVDLVTVAEGYVSPIGVVSVPDNTGRLFVIDQVGKIMIIGSDGKKIDAPFLDLTSKSVTLNAGYDERGLLGLAFHPDYQNNKRFFVYYQVAPRSGGPGDGQAWNNLSRVSEFKASSDANVADAGSERVVLEWDDPQSNHNGGTLAFGADGFLYIAIGDGGSANDVAPGHVPDWYAANEGGNGQDVEANLLGSILRIDVNATGDKPYGIPSDNPFVGKTGLDEIYAYGFRNPFRMSFDMQGTNQLYVGDAGQVLYEEIDVVTKGGNYGWNVKEGTHCFNTADNKTALSSCPATDVFGVALTDPVIEINNASNPAGGKAATIIGGNVYRGNEIPEFQGAYIFGTFAQGGSSPDGELFLSHPGGSGLWTYEEIELKNFSDDLGYYLKGFGQDNSGEIYLTVSGTAGPSGTTGKVLKLVKADK
ncbi:MAG TPA: PQQ-dependent sugar dehydrogenase [Cyclobacteriaceae bacterium]|nr:PQQ-dependent sugar dehydrogenase [Cyclobacteriaceae bacterium]